MSPSQIKKSRPFGMLLLIAFSAVPAITAGIVLSGCEAKVDQVSSLGPDNWVIPSPDFGKPPDAENCPNLSGRYLVNFLTYDFEQLQCDRVKITIECTLPGDACEQMGHAAQTEAVIIPDHQEREIASDNPSTHKLFETAYFEDSALVVVHRIASASADLKEETRYIHKANPCNRTDPEAAKDILGVETTGGTIGRCVSGPAQAFEVRS